AVSSRLKPRFPTGQLRHPEGILTYDPSANTARVRRQRWLALRRAWEISRALSGFVARYWLARQTWFFRSTSQLEREIACARYLAEQLMRLGPTFIKVGQALSTRPDLLPLIYVHELTRLQDQVPPFDTKLAIATIEGELEKPLHELFPDFDPKPISAASIGQVYRAHTREGYRVIVKVQRPNLPWIISFDLAILRFLAQWVERVARRMKWRQEAIKSRPRLPHHPGMLFIKDLPYVAIVDQFGKSLFDQTDFLLEGRNNDRFRSQFKDFAGVSSPLVYWEYTTRRVITQERIDGVKFNDVAGIERMGVNFRQIVCTGVRSVIKQVLEEGFFHADTHPGNIIVTPLGTIIYIDWGMTETISSDLRLSLVDLFLHLMRSDYAAFVEDLVKVEILPPDIDRALVIPIIADIYDTQLGKRGRLYSMQEIMDRFSDILYRYPFRLPERFSFLLRTVATMEGVVLNVWPDFRFLDVGLPYAAKLFLTVPDPRIRNRLVDELLPEGRLATEQLVAIARLATQETSFHLAEFLPAALAWLLSPEGERLHEALSDALFSQDAETLRELELLWQSVKQAMGPEPSAILLPALGWLRTPVGQEHLAKTLSRLAFLAPESQIVISSVQWLGQIAAATLYSVVKEFLSLSYLTLANGQLCWQPAIDWLAEGLHGEAWRDSLAELGTKLHGAWDVTLSEQTLAVLELALEQDLDLSSLVHPLTSLLLEPRGEAWRKLLFATIFLPQQSKHALTIFTRLVIQQRCGWPIIRLAIKHLLLACSPARHLANFQFYRC
ncbi:MAG: AarF/ABC1/UbiB kinase family protein, partial [Cyanobacteria bacterium NC_groundwater_1444_Ag_S-0.65um_54_12]|nr:AarF/ABC1/UbiB kinase family protein [Cyanobacteria bacterium NC_groundwater_1444_Ag_S-0.65um_54_12]